MQPLKDMEIFEYSHGTLVSRWSLFEQKHDSMILNCTKQQLLNGYDKYVNGALAQDAFSFLNKGEREFLLTGTTPDVWARMFPPEKT